MRNLTERQITQLYIEKAISLKQYHSLLSKVAESRNKEKIVKKKNKRSMSSTKWD